ACLLLFATTWMLAHFVVLWEPYIRTALVSNIVAPALAALGFSRFTASGMNKSTPQMDSRIKQVLQRFALPIAAFLILLGLFVSVNELNDFVIVKILPLSDASLLKVYGLYALACLAMMVLGNWYVNVNTFSMHGLYRNRLMRAFLGSVNPARKPDPFTNFDADDNMRMADAPAHPKAPL